MSRHNLPSGGWVELRDHMQLRQGHHDDLMKSLPRMDEQRPGGFMVAMNTGITVMMIQEWDIPYLPDPHRLPAVDMPETGESSLLRELTRPDSKALERALKPASDVLFPDEPSPDDDQLDNPGSPTTPASD